LNLPATTNTGVTQSDSDLAAIARKWQPALPVALLAAMIIGWLVPISLPWVLPLQGILMLAFWFLAVGSHGPASLVRRTFITYVLGTVFVEASLLGIFLGLVSFFAMTIHGHELQALRLMILQFWMGLAMMFLNMDASGGFWLVVSNLLTSFFVTPMLFVTVHMAINKELTLISRVRWLVLHVVSIGLLCPWLAVFYAIQWLRWGKNVPLLPPPTSEDVELLSSK